MKTAPRDMVDQEFERYDYLASMRRYIENGVPVFPQAKRAVFEANQECIRQLLKLTK